MDERLKLIVEQLRRELERAKALRDTWMTVSVEVLDEIFRGNVPVGGNENPPEDVNRMMYEMKAERDRLKQLLDLANAASDTTPNRRNFTDEFVCLLNKYSKENGSNTPDFILAEHLTNCLESWNSAVKAREEWYGRTFSAGSLQTVACAYCGKGSNTGGQFLLGGRWVCTEVCRKELATKQSYDDLAASGGIVDAP